MSKETIKMRKLRLQRIALKNSLNESETIVRTQREVIGTAWPHRDNDETAFKTIKKCGRIIKREKAKLRDYRLLLKTTKGEIRKLNRQHDIRMAAIRENEA